MKKKIILLVVLALAIILAGTFILLGCVKKDYAPEFSLTAKTIKIEDSSSNEYFNYEANENKNGKEMFNKLLAEYENSMKQSILAGIFSGTLSNEIDITLLSKAPAFSDYKVTFDFKAQMTLKKDGKNFVYGTNSEKTIEFSEVMFNLNDSKGFHEFNIYAIERQDGKTYYYEISTLANTYSFFKLVSTLDFK